MILSRTNLCPRCGDAHSNACFITYSNGSHCYSCGYNTSKSAEHYIFRNQSTVVAKTRNIALPQGLIYNPSLMPYEILTWLYSYYVTDELIKRYNIAYAPATPYNAHSIILPVRNKQGELVDYQRRFFPKAFFSTSTVKQNLMTAVRDSRTANGTIVLVEDYISAIRVGEHCECLCMFGTSLNETWIEYISTLYPFIWIWLDADEAGQTGAQKLQDRIYHTCKQLGLKQSFRRTAATTIKQIKTTEQPKELSPTQIKNILEAHKC